MTVVVVVVAPSEETIGQGAERSLALGQRDIAGAWVFEYVSLQARRFEEGAGNYHYRRFLFFLCFSS